MWKRALGVCCLCAAVLPWATAAGPKRAGKAPSEVQIGLAETMFRDISSEAALTAAEPLLQLLQTRTGIEGKFRVVADSETMAELLDGAKLHLGIMQGVEYAWLKARYPRLKPVLLACNQHVSMRAFLVSSVDSGIRSLADLKGKPFAMPRFTMHHAYFFLDQAIRETGAEPENYFAAGRRPSNPEAALDAVLEGKILATVVDGVALEAYRQRKPGRARRLRVIDESCAYPTAAFVARTDAFDADSIKNFHEGMTQAHRSLLGKQVLTLWRLTSFEPVPREYETLLDGVLKVHPKPTTPGLFVVEENEIDARR